MISLALEDMANKDCEIKHQEAIPYLSFSSLAFQFSLESLIV